MRKDLYNPDKVNKIFNEAKDAANQTQPPPPPRDRTEVNRQNAQFSTGPRTPAGRAISSQNARKHGILAQLSPVDLDLLYEQASIYVKTMGYENEAQRQLINVMAECDVRIKVVDRWEAAIQMEERRKHPVPEEHLKEPWTEEALQFELEAWRRIEPELAKCHRYKASLRSQRERACRQFYQIRREVNKPSRQKSSDPYGMPSREQVQADLKDAVIEALVQHPNEPEKYPQRLIDPDRMKPKE